MLPYRVIQLFSFRLPAIDNLTFHGVGFIKSFGVFRDHISPCCPCLPVTAHNWFRIGIVVYNKVLRFVTSPSIVVNKTVLPGAVMLSSSGNNRMG
jgi:hypothetical protein